MDDVGEILGCVFGLLMIVLVIATIATAISGCMTVGVVYGAGRSLWNYGLAFGRNVRREEVPV